MKNSVCFMVLLLMLLSQAASAQFYTVHSDNESLNLSRDPYQQKTRIGGKMDAKDLKSGRNGKKNSTSRHDNPSPNPMAKLAQKAYKWLPTRLFSHKKAKKNFFKAEGKPQKTVPTPLFDASDSLLLSLIQKRLSACMPMDLIHTTSRYGYRNHPIKRCRRFHDGIDLRGNKVLTFSMLPGRVETVCYGNTGYGHYVVIDHGQLRTLYGHLSRILVHEGDNIDAGTAIGLTGSTGMATGPHLHLRLQKKTPAGWKSVNPKPFIDFLNGYIRDISEKISSVSGNGEANNRIVQPLQPLSVSSLYAALKRHNVKYPKIVLAQAIIETGWFRSRICLEQNNLFGLRLRSGRFASFDSWEESIDAYKNWVQYKHRPDEDYYAFLNRIGYAGRGNVAYICKVKAMADRCRQG